MHLPSKNYNDARSYFEMQTVRSSSILVALRRSEDEAIIDALVVESSVSPCPVVYRVLPQWGD